MENYKFDYFNDSYANPTPTPTPYSNPKTQNDERKIKYLQRNFKEFIEQAFGPTLFA